jgi:dihydrodipicolinate synthase/N-acetylneuraminate lyase
MTFKCIIVPLITPLSDRDTLDQEGLARLNICDDFMADPFHRYKAPERAQVATILNSILPSS